MRITFKRKQYKTYEILKDEVGIVKRAIEQEGLDGFVKMVLASEAKADEFEDSWELLESDKDLLRGLK